MALKLGLCLFGSPVSESMYIGVAAKTLVWRGFFCSLSLGHVLCLVEAPISEQIPIFAQRFRRVHGAARAVAAGHGVSGTVAVAAPADAFGVLGVEGKLLGHAVCLMFLLNSAYCCRGLRFIDIAQMRGRHLCRLPI